MMRWDPVGGDGIYVEIYVVSSLNWNRFRLNVYHNSVLVAEAPREGVVVDIRNIDMGRGISIVGEGI